MARPKKVKLGLGNIVLYDTGKATWVYTVGTFAATEFHFKWGTQPNTYPNMKVFPVTSTGANADTIFPVGTKGQLYAKIFLATIKGEGPSSAEVPFVLSDGLPDGSISLTIG